MRIRSSSFDPHRLRKEVQKLERMEAKLRSRVGAPPTVTKRRPGLLTRWWRLLFGG